MLPVDVCVSITRLSGCCVLDREPGPPGSQTFWQGINGSASWMNSPWTQRRLSHWCLHCSQGDCSMVVAQPWDEAPCEPGTRTGGEGKWKSQAFNEIQDTLGKLFWQSSTNLPLERWGTWLDSGKDQGLIDISLREEIVISEWLSL